MSMATMTIAGMYQFKDGLFNNLKLPDGINKEDVINQILLDGSNFEILYSDFNFMQDAIGLWSNTWYRTFENGRKHFHLSTTRLRTTTAWKIGQIQVLTK